MSDTKSAADQLALPPEQRQVICVLGGRSGTSLMTRLVNLLGVSLGDEKRMLEACSANEKGFWEHKDFVAINEEIIGRFGGKWPDLKPLPGGLENDKSLDDLRDRAIKMIRREFNDAPLWGWKDPRACATLPFWQKLIPDMRYILCFRNPVDTARSNAKTMKLAMSMEKRPLSFLKKNAWDKLEQMGEEKLFQAGVGNWIQFADMMLRQTAGKRRMVLMYEDVMADTDAELRRVARFIGKPEAASDPEVLKNVRAFKSDKLRHHDTSLDQVLAEPRLPMVAKAVFLSLRTRATLERKSQEFVDRGQADPKLEEAMSLDSLGKLADEAMRQRQQMAAQLMKLKGMKGKGGNAAAGAAAEAEPPPEQAQKQIAEHVRRIVVERTPADAKIVVVSHGDEQLLAINGRNTAHFPQDDSGGYIGFHPADSASAIEYLRLVEKKGAKFLLFPQPQLWWLDHYKELRDYLDTKHRKVCGDEHCVLYQLA